MISNDNFDNNKGRLDNDHNSNSANVDMRR